MADTREWIRFQLGGSIFGEARVIFNPRLSWEKEVSIRVADSQNTLCSQFNNNDPSKPGNNISPGQEYTIECHFKRHHWNPGLPWEQALGRMWTEVRPDNKRWLVFAWWTGEDDTAEPCATDSNDRFNDMRVSIRQQ